ncbi:phytanoyl-CoA dioxygenase family protein [Mucilaginibacter limnophilus]|uniref:Phytanoyl-CoA dioxygenase family protein n=1 Tax=Mucilaginibacter limnophilus TaxID=1932778 RepID=A0A437MFX3_9SPHI|nr:phytanoyl-CoA dioxygenase family protein [Mucilaginibacter limnophilus]RVT96527.1 phytanoyl-CoA dioxygenase family protein [Mucilaginibacter limnophilus]
MSTVSAEVKDLSTIHALVSDFFKTPETPEEWDKYRLSDEQVAFFNEYGYLNNIKLLEEWQIDRLNQELAAIADPEHPGNPLFYYFFSNESGNPDTVLFHALGAWRITGGFHDVIYNPAFLMAASQLLGGKGVRFWHDQLFCKPAKHGGVVAWHQDYSYWTRTAPMQHLTCWIGLDDANVDNGCLYYVPKSHKWGLLDKPELAGDMEGLMDYLTEEQKAEFKPIPIEMKKGYGSFHHPLMVHGSYENRSERSRRAFVLNVFADGTQSNSNEEILKGIPGIPAGEVLEGQFFPLLFDPAAAKK